MTPPRLYDIHETAVLTRRSTSWLYHEAGVTIPVTQHRPGGRLFWTDEQIIKIIQGGAKEPKARKPAQPARRGSQPVEADFIRLPQARPEARRKRKPTSNA